MKSSIETHEMPITAIAKGLLDAEKMIERYRQLHPQEEATAAEDFSEEEIRKMFGERVRIMRKLRGMTQSELADKIRATQSTITNVENGRRAPSLKNLLGFSKALNVSIDWLLEVSEPTPN